MGANISKQKARPSKAEMEAHECPIHHRCYRKHKDYIEPGPPPVYEKESDSDNPAVWAPGECTCGPYSRVASMPLKRPLDGHEYLTLTDRCPPPARVCSCVSCNFWISPSSRVRRHVAHGWNTSDAMHARDRVTKTANFSFHDRLGQRHPAMVVYGLAPGDVERPVRGRDDWTTDWNWALALRCEDLDGGYRVDVRYYFGSVPDRVQIGVPWWDEQLTRVDEPSEEPEQFKDHDGVRRWKSTWAFTDRSRRPPRYCASLAVVHESCGKLAGVDPWDYITAAGTEM